MAEEKSLEGLGGWLILVAIGMIFGPIRLTFELYSLYQQIFATGTWQELGVEDSISYHPLWQPLIATEMTVNLVFIAT